MKGYSTAQEEEIISQQQKNSSKNFMDKFPNLNLKPSSLLPVVNEGIKDIKSCKKKIIRRACLICGLLSIFVGLMSLIAEDCDIETFLIYSGITLGGSVYLGFFITMICIIQKEYLIMTSELSKSTDYYQQPSGKESKNSIFKPNKNNNLFVVIKDSKFGCWDFFNANYIIKPEYDYLEWREKNKLLYAEAKGESFVIDINGIRLY